MVECAYEKTIVFAHRAALVHSAMPRVKTTEPWMVTVSKREGIMPSDAEIRQQELAQLALQERSLEHVRSAG